jgi:uncharacterized protein (TIGR02452 family)
MSPLIALPCLDSDELANTRQRELDIRRKVAQTLGMTAVHAIQTGRYRTRSGAEVHWKDSIDLALQQKQSIRPEDPLPDHRRPRFDTTRVQVSNETTLGASQRLIKDGLRPLALNFANGIHPGGGFLNGARAQEENLCRSSALYQALFGDPMYDAHRQRPLPDSSDWALLSPDVPVFRTDEGTELDEFWPLSVITCAAPVATSVGQPLSGDLLQKRIHRVLAIARAFEFDTLVLGAWGCGAFGNDPDRTANDFMEALDGEFVGSFSHVQFAISDWSPGRKFLGPFRDALLSRAGSEASDAP